MSEQTKHGLSLAGLFAAFMLVQLTVLSLGNRAGEGLLSTERRELVYYAMQVFVILGFLVYAFLGARLRAERGQRAALLCALAVLALGTTVLLCAGRDSYFFLAVTFAAVLALGYLGGAVYHRMSLETAAGTSAARSMGLGCAAAVALQYLLQLRWGVTPLLPAVLLAAFALLVRLLLRAPAAAASETAADNDGPVPVRRIVCTVLIAAALLLFTSFYNGYIHHLQVRTGYTDYNVYSWPRLMLIPCYLLFAFLGDRKRGRLAPVVSLCLALAALLNSVLAGSSGAYWVNMCLFYCAIAASVAYYDLSFWRLARRTRRPAFWASAGRILDSVAVLLGGVLRISSLPAAAVLAADVAGLAAAIVLMAVNGDFGFVTVQSPAEAPRSPETDLTGPVIARCGLTPAEASVLRELVRTEDKQEAVAARLGMSVNTLRHHVTSIYRKTGAETRAGLVYLCAGSPERGAVARKGD